MAPKQAEEKGAVENLPLPARAYLAGSYPDVAWEGRTRLKIAKGDEELKLQPEYEAAKPEVNYAE